MGNTSNKHGYVNKSLFKNNNNLIKIHRIPLHKCIVNLTKQYRFKYFFKNNTVSLKKKKVKIRLSYLLNRIRTRGILRSLYVRITVFEAYNL